MRWDKSRIRPQNDTHGTFAWNRELQSPSYPYSVWSTGAQPARMMSGMSTYAERFGLALSAAMRRGDQARLAVALDLSTSTINGYAKGASEPPPRTAVAIEQVLGVEPGSLTIHLGYLPPSAAEVSVSDIEGAIISDERLDGRSKRLLLELVSQMAGSG